MVKINFFGRKMSFLRPENKFFMQQIVFGQITTEIFAFYGENIFLVKIVKKSRHDCVKSEHVLCVLEKTVIFYMTNLFCVPIVFHHCNII